MECRPFFLYLAVALLGVLLAIPGLEDIPFTQQDEITYFSTALSNQVVVYWILNNSLEIIGGSVNTETLLSLFTEKNLQLSFPYYSKPIYDTILLLSISIWDESIGSVLYVNLISFACGIFLIGKVGEQLFGRTVGLLAALFFSTSGSVLVYARSGMAHMPSISFCLAGIYLFLHFLQKKECPSTFWKVGFLWGVGFAIHPNLTPYIGLIGMGGLVYHYKFNTGKDALVYALSLTGGVFGLLLFIEVGHQLFGWALRDVLIDVQSWQTVPFRTYFEQLSMHASAVTNADVPLSIKLYTYLLLYWAHEGIFVTLLVIWGTGKFLVKAKSDVISFVVLIFWIPILYFTLSQNQAVYRYAAGLVIPSAIIAAVSMEQILQRLAVVLNIQRKWVTLVACMGIIAVNFSHFKPIYQVGSAWKESAHWLKSQGESRVVSHGGATLWELYGIEEVTPSAEVGIVRYTAIFKRYQSETERKFVFQNGEEIHAISSFPHKRADILLEVDFLKNDPVLNGIENAPFIGDTITELKNRALFYKNMHRLDIYKRPDKKINHATSG